MKSIHSCSSARLWPWRPTARSFPMRRILPPSSAIKQRVCFRGKRRGPMSDEAVVLEEVERGIARITMQDRVHKNGFSDELISGLIDAFNEVQQADRYKVVVLTGYGSYFAS